MLVAFRNIEIGISVPDIIRDIAGVSDNGENLGEALTLIREPYEQKDYY